MSGTLTSTEYALINRNQDVVITSFIVECSLILYTLIVFFSLQILRKNSWTLLLPYIELATTAPECFFQHWCA